jgi:transcriptional regulator with XRE-family HTH domain
MAENLWEIRRRKKMKVRDLAAKAGVPASLIHQYEAGEKPISQSHLRQFARALIVETWEIELLSDPKPREQRGPGRPKPAGAPRPSRQPKPARPSQLEHLLRLTERFPDVDKASLEAEAGKPLEELTKPEASKFLYQLQERLRVEQPPPAPHPFDRHRAYLPEGVDEFELNYLTQAQEAGDTLYVTLFDASQVTGQVIGFGPYSITLRQVDAQEITINKLAIAYYRKEGTSP